VGSFDHWTKSITVRGSTILPATADAATVQAAPVPSAAAKPASKPAGGGRGSGSGGERGDYRRRGQEAPPPPRPPLKLPDDPALRLAVELFNGRVIAPTEAG
jgi:hypothetical protein